MASALSQKTCFSALQCHCGRLAVSAFVVFLASVTTFAQRTECRQPSAQELAAVDHAQRVMQQVVEVPIVQLGWRLNTQKADGGPKSVANDANPTRPLMLCWPIYDATFDLTQNYPQYAALRAQADQAQNQMNQWMAACIKSNYKGCDAQPQSLVDGQRAVASLSIEVRATENVPYMHLAQSGSVQKINAAGADLAYRSDSQQQYLTDTTICAGAWKPQVFFSNGPPVLFPFQHPRGTPYIENLCVKITAAAQLADEMVGKIDWKQLSQALTR